MKYAHPSSGTATFDQPTLWSLISVPLLVFYWGLASSWFPALPSDYVTSVMIGLSIIVLFFVIRINRLIPLVFLSPAKFPLQLFLLFLLAQLLSIVIGYLSFDGVDPSQCLRHLEMTLPSFAALFVIAASPSFQATRRSFLAARSIVALVTVVPAISFLFPAFAIGEIQGIESGTIRSFGVFGDTAAFYISFFAFSFLRTRSHIPFVVSAFALLTTGSITALLVFAASIAFELFRQSTASSNSSIYAAIAVIVIALFVATGSLGAIVEQLSTILGIANPLQRLADTSINSSERYLSSLQGFEYWTTAPIFGHGYNSYAQLVTSGDLITGANISNTTNQAMQTLVDSGFLGLSLLAAFFWTFFATGTSSTSAENSRDEFGVNTWLLMFILINHSAVYILPAYHFTTFLFGLLGFSLRSRMYSSSVESIRNPGRWPNASTSTISNS